MDTPTPELTWRPEVVPGERIFLSQVLREDVPLYARWFSDLELTTYQGAVGQSFTIEQEQEWFERVGKDSATKTFAIVVREGQRLIGNVSLMHINHRRGVAELGIAIGDKSCWGQGYGSEAVRLMCDYGFTFLELHTIYLWHFGFNERGHHAYLKAGFKVAGRLRGGDVFNGKRYDDILMDITREDFGPSRLSRMIGQIRDE
jgi:RimJ/RimL family protein N-acetyltransferase